MGQQHGAVGRGQDLRHVGGVGTLAIEQIGFGGPSHPARVPAIGRLDELDDCCDVVGCRDPDVQSRRANSVAQYVSTMSAPARLIDVNNSLIARSRSIQPLAAAASTIAYSPDTE